MLKNIFNTSHSGLTDAGLLILRLSFGILMLTHGIPKLLNFSLIADAGVFLPVLGSPVLGLSLAIFAEVLMSLFLIAGLLTRIATLPLIVTMLVAAFVAHAGDPFTSKEPSLLYLFPYITILLTGPGKYSLDHVMVRMWK
jgi:putative oxidoreductase